MLIYLISIYLAIMKTHTGPMLCNKNKEGFTHEKNRRSTYRHDPGLRSSDVRRRAGDAGYVREICAGYDADIVVLDRDYEVVQTYVAGVAKL